MCQNMSTITFHEQRKLDKIFSKCLKIFPCSALNNYMLKYLLYISQLVQIQLIRPIFHACIFNTKFITFKRQNCNKIMAGDYKFFIMAIILNSS